jgi:hypothetical protein
LVIHLPKIISLEREDPDPPAGGEAKEGKTILVCGFSLLKVRK